MDSKVFWKDTFINGGLSCIILSVISAILQLFDVAPTLVTILQGWAILCAAVAVYAWWRMRRARE